jgi:hypothetical protein
MFPARMKAIRDAKSTRNLRQKFMGRMLERFGINLSKDTVRLIELDIRKMRAGASHIKAVSKQKSVWHVSVFGVPYHVVYHKKYHCVCDVVCKRLQLNQ